MYRGANFDIPFNAGERCCRIRAHRSGASAAVSFVSRRDTRLVGLENAGRNSGCRRWGAETDRKPADISTIASGRNEDGRRRRQPSFAWSHGMKAVCRAGSSETVV
jgi:hypothetical protein